MTSASQSFGKIHSQCQQNIESDQSTILRSSQSSNQNEKKMTSYQQKEPKDDKMKILIISIVIILIAFIFLIPDQSPIANNQNQINIKVQSEKIRKNEQITNTDNHKNQEQDGFSISIQEKPVQQVKPTNKNPLNTEEPDSPIADKYFFKVPMEQILKLSRPERFFGASLQKIMGEITFKQLQLSLRLLEVVHNVDLDGKLKIQLAPYDHNDGGKKQQKIRQLLLLEKQIYDTRYSTGKYLKNQLPFCIVVPTYNNVKSRLYLRNLDSLFMQNYQNYHIVLIDDNSPQNTGQFVRKYLEEKQIPDQLIKVIVNKKNVLALANIYNAIHYHCNAGDIVALIDGDDSLIGRQVLAIFNAVYQKSKCVFAYSNYLHIMHNKEAVLGSSSRAIPPDILRDGAIRKSRTFYTSHLLTFYADLFRLIKRQDFIDEDGEFFKFAYDVAMTTPMIEMARSKIFYIPEITYEYRYDTGQNDLNSGQIRISNMVYDKPQYTPLLSYPFVDDRENYLKRVPKHSPKGQIQTEPEAQQLKANKKSKLLDNVSKEPEKIEAPQIQKELKKISQQKIEKSEKQKEQLRLKKTELDKKQTQSVDSKQSNDKQDEILQQQLNVQAK